MAELSTLAEAVAELGLPSGAADPPRQCLFRTRHGTYRDCGTFLGWMQRHVIETEDFADYLRLLAEEERA